MTKAELVDQDCTDYLYCGLPYLVPVLTMLWKTHWLPGPEPELRVPVTMNVIKKEPITDGTRVTVEVDGPTHIDVMISPVLGVKLTEWSLNSKKPLAGPMWNGRNTYFIYYAYGLKRVPLRFSMDFKVIQWSRWRCSNRKVSNFDVWLISAFVDRWRWRSVCFQWQVRQLITKFDRLANRTGFYCG